MRFGLFLRWTVGVAALIGVAAVVRGEAGDISDVEMERQLNPSAWVIVLGAGRHFPSVKREALAIGKRSHVRFDARGMVFDPKKGLIVRDADPVWDGSYLFRRDDTMEVKPGVEAPFISVEESDVYPGMRKGYYIVVGGIAFSHKETTAELRRFRRAIPTAYAAKTTVFIGCIH